MINIIFYALIPVVFLALFTDFLIFDEEVILIVSVLIFLGASYNAVSGFLVSSLSDRAEVIKKSFDNYFLIKIGTLNTLVSTYQKVYETNSELVKVIGITHKHLEDIRNLRTTEVEYFLNYSVNQHLQGVLAEELQLFRSIYAVKLQKFFSELQLTWSFQEFKDVLSSEEQNALEIFDEVEKASVIINNNKLALLPLSIISKSDLVTLSGFANIANIFSFVAEDINAEAYFIFENLLALKSIGK